MVIIFPFSFSPYSAAFHFPADREINPRIWKKVTNITSKPLTLEFAPFVASVLKRISMQSSAIIVVRR